MILLALAAAVSLHTCKAENAHYILRTAPDVTARFVTIPENRHWPFGVGFIVNFRKTMHHYYFIAVPGGTNGLQYFKPTDNFTAKGWTFPSPDGGMSIPGIEYVGFDQRYNVVDDVPRRGERPPLHILSSDMGDMIWHRISFQDDQSVRDGMPKQFFDLVRCDHTH